MVVQIQLAIYQIFHETFDFRTDYEILRVIVISEDEEKTVNHDQVIYTVFGYYKV